MKRLFYTLIFCLLCSPVFAGGVLMMAGGVDSGVCTTPQTGNHFNEGFIGTGYENTASENIGANGTLNPNYTLTGSPPAGSCTEGLLSSRTTGTTDSTYTQWDTGTAITDGTTHDIYFELQVKGYTLPNDNDELRLVRWENDSNIFGTPTIDLRLYNDPTNGLSLRASGATIADDEAINIDTWYTVKIHLDATAASSYFQIDSGTEHTFTRNALDGEYLNVGLVGLGDTDEAFSMEWGRLWINIP